MRAVAARSGALRMVEIAQPEPAEGEVLVKNLACGICGSDLHFMLYGEEMMQGSSQSGNGRFAPDFSRDIVMGHEFCCEIVGYGPNTPERLPIGSRITSVPSKGAYSNVYPGAYSEYMVLDAGMVLPVPDHVSTEEAATTEPMAVGLHAVRAGQFAGGEPAVVYGCGPVGLATIASLRNEGASTNHRLRLLAGAARTGGRDGRRHRGRSARVSADGHAAGAGLPGRQRGGDVRCDRRARDDRNGDARSAAAVRTDRGRGRLHAGRHDHADGRDREGAGTQSLCSATRRRSSPRRWIALPAEQLTPSRSSPVRLVWTESRALSQTLGNPEEHCKIIVTPHEAERDLGAMVVGGGRT